MRKIFSPSCQRGAPGLGGGAVMVVDEFHQNRVMRPVLAIRRPLNLIGERVIIQAAADAVGEIATFHILDDAGQEETRWRGSERVGIRDEDVFQKVRQGVQVVIAGSLGDSGVIPSTGSSHATQPPTGAVGIFHSSDKFESIIGSPTNLGEMMNLLKFHRSWVTAMGVVVLATSAEGYTAADADTIFEAHSKAFFRQKDGNGWHTKSTEGGKADFWTRLEMMEMVVDAHARTRDPKTLEMFDSLFRGFLADHGRTWERNEFNDDIMWGVIALSRAFLACGNTEYLDVAKENFDLCYKRAISPDLGGGLWWKTDNRSKNACVNGPGAIAAFLLGLATKDESYTAKAKELFLWERKTLFDEKTGRVADSIRRDGRIASFALTYNQGTFVGAANLLGYHKEAKLAATYTMEHLCRDGYLPRSGENGDGGGFNGIGVRWITMFMKNQQEEATFLPWLRKNAEAAWQARREPDNLTWCAWPRPTPPGTRYSWGCSNAVVILQAVPPAEATEPE